MQKIIFLLPVWIHLLAMAGTFGATVTCVFLSRMIPENQDDEHEEIDGFSQTVNDQKEAP